MRRSKSKSVETIDQYIAGYPPDVQKILRKIRATIRKAVPAAEESISYNIPTLKLHGRQLIYFAAFKEHIGVYPVTASMRVKFKDALAKYQAGKGTLRFPLDRPIPYALIGRIVKFKTKERSS